MKQLAVQEYLAGGESLVQIARKYRLRNKKQLQDWIKRYTTHGNFKSESGGSKVSQTKQFSLEERVRIVLWRGLSGQGRKIVAYEAIKGGIRSSN